MLLLKKSNQTKNSRISSQKDQVENYDAILLPAFPNYRCRIALFREVRCNIIEDRKKNK